MSKAGRKLIGAMKDAVRYTELTQKADDLLAAGDAAAKNGDKAESKKLLRKCRRTRDKAAEFGKPWTA